MKNILEALMKKGIAVEYTDLDCRGVFIPSDRTIYINESLSEFDRYATLLHESTHALNHDEMIVLYKNSPTFHEKMEGQANQSMMSTLIEESDGYYNLAMVSEYFGLGVGFEPHRPSKRTR